MLRLALIPPLLLLSGCFVSSAPLITASTASRPFQDGAAYSEAVNCASPNAMLLECKGYQVQGKGSIAVRDGAYVVQPDPANVPTLPAGTGAREPTFLLADIGGGDFLVQLDMGDHGAGPGYMYQLIRIEGRNAFIYSMSCEQVGDAAYVKAGLLKAITNELMVPTCEAGTLAGLTKVFKLRLEAGIEPEKRLTFE